jgi:uncharacterized hydantoinase/oxoprolinase family protein
MRKEREIMSYQPAQYDFSTSNETMSYYYDVSADKFVSKIEFLDQNRVIDCFVVDKTATAQEIDEMFDKVYPHYNTDLNQLLEEIS